MILDRILENKLREIDLLKRNTNIKSMIRAADRVPQAQSLTRALCGPGRVALLAEIKRASPSRGIIRGNSDPREIARVYRDNGADAISVLTDLEFFRGRPEDLTAAREASSLPVLRKDFILDPVQIYQSRIIGADAVLLICAMLSPGDLSSLKRAAEDCGMEALVEVHRRSELEAALAAGASLIGINNRDLKTFRTDINTTFRLCREMDLSRVVVVSESGISTAADMAALKKAGVSAALVGEALMSAPDMAAKVRELSRHS